LIPGEACATLSKKLDGFLTQRGRFQKTIDLAHEQLTTWQSANRNALLNAAEDGLEHFSGELLEDLTNAAGPRTACNRFTGGMPDRWRKMV